jgi:hypothetical protein
MKKIISIIVFIFLIAASLPAQKVNFSLNNARIDGDKFLIDVYANVYMSQIWNVGPTCIRIRYWTTDPANGITLVSEDPVTNANINLSNNSSYYDMTSTSIMGDTAVSLNIQQLLTGSSFPLSSGAYWFGTLKFNYLSPNCCINMAFLTNSAVFNGIGTPMANPADWTYTDPPPCIVGVENNIKEVPTTYTLSQNYPNPFNPSTSIKYSMPKAGFVSLKVYDILGREVASLVNQHKSAGTYIVDFNASTLTSGMYFYKLETNDFVAVKKMVLVK